MNRTFQLVVLMSLLPLACQSSDSVPLTPSPEYLPASTAGANAEFAQDILNAPAPAPLFTQLPTTPEHATPSSPPVHPSRSLSPTVVTPQAGRAEAISWSSSQLDSARSSDLATGLEAVASTTTSESTVPAIDRAPEPREYEDFDGVEELFIENMAELRSVLRRLDQGETLDNFDMLRKADAEKRLIALFLLRHERNLKEFRELVDSLSRDSSGILALEILKAAFYQELGLDSLRDQALEESTTHIHDRKLVRPGNFQIVNMAFASNIGGFRNIIRVDPAVFRSGQETLLYGEFENFMNTEVVGNTAAQRYRRSFTAHATLRDTNGKLQTRHALLTADQFVADEADPSHFWSNFRVPSNLRPGTYTLEVLAVDLESQVLATSTLEFTVKL